MIRAYIIWGIAATFSLYQFFMQGTISVMIPDLMEDLLLDTVEIGFLSSCFFYTYILFQVPAGIIIDYFGPRKMLLIGITTYVCAVILFACAQTFAMAIAARLLMGLMSTFAIVNAFCLAARWFSPAHFALLVGLTEMISLCGGIIGEGPLAFLIKALGWRMAMLTCSGAGALLLVMAYVFVQDSPENSGLEKPQSIRETLGNFRIVSKIKQVWVLGIFCGLLFAIVPAFGALWSVPYLMERYDLSKEFASSISSIFFLGVASFSIFFGYLGMKMRRHPILISATSLALLIMTLILYLPSLPLIGMAFLLFCLGAVVSAYGQAFSIIGEIVPKSSSGSAMGLANMLGIAFGAPLLQPLIGKIADTSGFTSALIVLPITLLLALLTSFLIRERNAEQTDELR